MWLKDYVKKHEHAPKVIADSIMDWLGSDRADAVFVIKDDEGYLISANVSYSEWKKQQDCDMSGGH